MRRLVVGALCSLGLLAAPLAQANSVSQEASRLISTQSPAAAGIKPLPKPVNLRFCLFDIMGNTGDITSMAKDLALEARKYNLMVELKVYTDERVASEEFKAGQCEAVGISTLRAKQFNKVVGSIDSPGNLPTYEHMVTLLKTLSNPALASLGINGRYQVAAVLPIGAIYVMVNDRSINSIEKAAGKRVVVLDWDPSQAKMISAIGAQPVPADISSYGGKFNNGQADIIAAPAMAYKPLELHKGIGKKGGVIRFPLLQATATIMIRRDLLLPQIPDLDSRLQKLREFGLGFLPNMVTLLKKADNEIPANMWVELSAAEKAKYGRMLREARLHMTKDGVYEPTMMNLLKRVRCKHDPANEECSSFDE